MMHNEQNRAELDREAEAFAVNFMLPRDAMIAETASQTLPEMCFRWGVTSEVMTDRLVGIGMVEQLKPEPAPGASKPRKQKQPLHPGWRGRDKSQIIQAATGAMGGSREAIRTMAEELGASPKILRGLLFFPRLTG
jgi:Zn-dependent peptidase ImmA (M78 family)